MSTSTLFRTIKSQTLTGFAGLVTSFLVAAITLTITLTATSAATAHDIAAEMTLTANAFAKSLTPEQQQKLSFEFDDKNREDWHFIPKQRPGLPIGELTPKQHDLAIKLLQTALSHRGLETSKQIMSLESVLHELENGNPKRDPKRYNFYFFGTPTVEKPWGWRIEGHHLSINLTIADGKVLSQTPMFMGANPANVPSGDRQGFRALAMQEDLGRSLVKQLSAKQKEIAVFSQTAPKDVINGPAKAAARLNPPGIAASEMTVAQRKLLTQLIDCYLDNFRPEVNTADRKKMADAGLENIHFAWAGFIQPGKPHYYRVQGPTFILEYDNAQNKANHVHTLWRDTENDFGKNLLKEHYEKSAHDSQLPAIAK